jgi:hypothetical protein
MKHSRAGMESGGLCAWLVFISTLSAVTQYRSVDEPGVELAQRLVAHLKPFQLKWPDTGKENIRILYQPAHHFPPSLMGQVQAHAPFIAVEVLPPEVDIGFQVCRNSSPDSTPAIPAFRILHMYYFSAEIG